MRIAARLAVWLLLCGIAQAALADTPSRVKASYDVFKGNLRIATIMESYVRTQDSFQIESVSKATGLLALFKPETIRLSSRGLVSAKGLRPVAFSSKRELDSERNVGADLDWTNNRITLTDRNGRQAQPLPAGTQDRLSAMYQFMFMPLQGVSTLDFHMTNGNKLDIYNYRVMPGDAVITPLGTFKTLYVASRSKVGESSTEIWLATERNNIPCKMVITDPDGGKLTQVLTQLDLEP